jgi:hypothetical protein
MIHSNRTNSASGSDRHPKGRNEVEESEAKPETCGPPPRAYKGAAPTRERGKPTDNAIAER